MGSALRLSTFSQDLCLAMDANIFFIDDLKTDGEFSILVRNDDGSYYEGTSVANRLLKRIGDTARLATA